VEKAPGVCVVHLKRFAPNSSKKLDSHVAFGTT